VQLGGAPAVKFVKPVAQFPAVQMEPVQVEQLATDASRVTLVQDEQPPSNPAE
jgi:hypothetical protein